MNARPLLWLALLAASQAAQAHNRGTSWSHWQVEGTTAQVRAQLTQLELTRLQLHPQHTADYTARVGEELASRLQLWSGEQPCAPGPVTVVAHPDGWLSARWTLQCSDALPQTVRSTLFQSVAPGHVHLAKIERAGSAPIERALTYAEPAFTFGEPEPAPASLGRYMTMGVGHILGGWDHLCFVLALVLLAANLREVALIVTGFTVAHSLTLAGAVLGWISAPTPAIEALIGFSIVVVAAENLWLRSGRGRWVPGLLVAVLVALAITGQTGLAPLTLVGLALFTACYFALAQGTARPLRLRTSVTFLFGLVHGLGFAGVLLPLQLPPERLATGLLGFNLGVELGQLLVIALAWPLFRWLAHAPKLHWAGDSASALACAMGTFWFVTRAFT